MRKLLTCAAVVAGALYVPAVLAASLQPNPGDQYRPTGKGFPEVDPNPNAGVHNQAGGPPSGKNGITYHGGPVMTNPAGVNVYYIWYGDWTNYGAAQTVLRNFMGKLGGTSLWNTNSTYYDAAAKPIVNAVTFKGEAVDTPTPTTAQKTLSDADVFSVVKRVIGTATPDSNAVYFVLTAPDIAESSGFGSQYCGWHTHGTHNNTDVKYSFVGNPALYYLSGCAGQTTSPNGDAGGDAMASVVFHELSEAASDPDLNAWYDTRGYENADKCAWKWGTTSTLSNGAKYNVSFSDGKKYLIQQNWINASGGYCSVSY